MKTTLTGLLFCLALCGGVREGHGQIRDDEASMNFLAVHCGMSAGKSASNYEEYGAKLARTIGDLNVVQQERVFGFVPKPTGASGSSWEGATGAVFQPQTPASLADSLLAGEPTAGTNGGTATGGSPSTETGSSPLLDVNLELEAGTTDGISAGAAISVGTSLIGPTIGAEAEVTNSSPALLDAPTEASPEGAQSAGGEGGGGQGGSGDLPRGYQNLPEWLTEVIERFEDRYLQ